MSNSSEPRRPRASMVACPKCGMPSTATSTQGPVTYRKCKGWDGEPGCGHPFSVANGNVDYDEQLDTIHLNAANDTDRFRPVSS